MAAEEELGFHIGQRVCIINTERSPQCGTVKYVGSVQNFEGSWVGVDWDSAQGKHNGTVKGIHYFDTSGEQSGSFVRPHNLSGGISLLEALSLRYKAAQSTDSEREDMYVMSVSQLRVAVEFVGKSQVEERQGRLECLKVATLTNAGVRTAGPPGQLQAACPNINELDLTGNLLPDWHEVGRICKQLPALRILDLSSSRILVDSSGPVPLLSSLTIVVLNNCGMSWKQVELLKGSLPNVQELSLCHNKLQVIQVVGQVVSTGPAANVAFVHGFESLRLLNLEENHFESWHEIVKLSQLKSLEQLYLSGNSLKDLFYPSLSSHSIDPQNENDRLSPFASLRCLLLGRNQISDWPSVDALDQFPALQDPKPLEVGKEVRLSENPLTDPVNGSASRYMLVARIGKITTLNGSQVKPRERRDSEIRYVRNLLTSSQSSNIEDIIKCHPRFEHLRTLHEIPMDIQSRGATGQMQKMASSLLSVRIICVAASIGEKAPVTKKLPRSTSIGRLKAVCESIFRLKSDRQRLFYSDQDSPLPIPLDNDMESLAELDFAEGASIIVDEVQD